MPGASKARGENGGGELGERRDGQGEKLLGGDRRGKIGNKMQGITKARLVIISSSPFPLQLSNKQ